MAESSQLRLVRCPKCENLLPDPDLPNFSPYKCGGCGAVLRAKRNGNPEEGLLKGSEQSEQGNNIANVSGVDTGGIRRVGRGVVGMESASGTAPHGSSFAQPKRTDVSPEYDKVKRGKERMRRMRMFADEYESYSRGLARNKTPQGKNFDSNADRTEYVRESRDPRESILPSRPVGLPGFDDLIYHDEGQSSYEMNPVIEHGEGMRYPDPGLDEFVRIESLENGRDELLRKLDKLKDQITRSCDVADKPDHYSRFVHGLSKKPIVANSVPQFVTRPAGFGPYPERSGLGMLDPYPRSGWGYPGDFLHRPDINKPDMIHRPTHMPYHDYSPGYYGDVNPDLFMLHRHENFFHQSACSCVHCREKNWRMPQNQRFHPGPSNPNFCHNQNPILRNTCGSTNLHTQKPRMQLSNDVDSDNGGLDYHRPRKIGVPLKRVRFSHPISGGAPFMTCDNCFELLKLSRKHISLVKKQQKMKCGSCSSVIFLELGNKGLITSASACVDQVSPEIGDDEASNENNGNSFGKDLDNSDQNFVKSSVSGGSKRQSDPLSSTSSLYDEVESPGQETSRTHDSPSNDLPEQAELDHSPENGAITKFDEMVKSDQCEEEKASFEITDDARENYVEASGVATEISLNGLSNSYVSQTSVDTNKEHSKTKKGSESFFAGLIKKGFKDFAKANRVFVNGHLIPNHAVKKAEKLAGPIQPGNYWYDKKAGFWGVMGHPCLGIIMPNIEEFNYPVPKDCSVGNTGVLVNERELNQRDLDLLVKRGLPNTGNKSYLVQITGELVDEETGEQLDSLGKLAPTVLRAGRGFGMKVHRFLAQQKS